MTEREFARAVIAVLAADYSQATDVAAYLVVKHSAAVSNIMQRGLTPHNVKVAAGTVMAAEARATDGKYGEITASLKQFHPGEPVFLLRATDPDAAGAVIDYAERCVNRGCSADHVTAVRDHATRIIAWQRANPHLVKAKAD